jgi:hypothetical protein
LLCDPARAGELAQGKPVTIGADDDIEEAFRTMVDGHDLIGMVSQADLAKRLPAAEVGELVEVISR